MQEERAARASLRLGITWSSVLACFWNWDKANVATAQWRRGQAQIVGFVGTSNILISLLRAKGSHFRQENDEQIVSPGCTSESAPLSNCLSLWGISQQADESKIWFPLRFVLLLPQNQARLSRVCILSHFRSTLTVRFSCLGPLLLLPAPTFRPSGDRVSGEFTSRRAWRSGSR